MKKTIWIGLSVICLIIIFIIVFMIIFNNKENCDFITGGGYNIIFHTNSDAKIDAMDVCIACAPDAYEDLPIPKRDGYVFKGWYYDKRFKRKVNVKSTLDITPVPNKKGDCVIGYKDISLYAKWSKE